MKNKNIPFVPKELIEFLEENTPPKDLLPIDRRDDIMFYAGKRAMIKYLRVLYDKQDKGAL